MSHHRTRSILARAAASALYFNKEGDGGGGGEDKGEGDKGKDKKPPEQKKDDKGGDGGDAEKITLTQAELDQRLKDATDRAVKDAEDRARKSAEKEKADRDADEAKKRGEFEKLYQGEVEGRKKDQQERDALKLDLRKTQVNGRLRDYLAEHHKDYAGAAKYIAPLLKVAADTSDDDADKQIKAAVEQYVKDNPRSRAAGPPPSHQHKLPAGSNAPPKEGETQQRVRPRGPARMF